MSNFKKTVKIPVISNFNVMQIAKIPSPIKKIGEVLDNAGHEAFLVGGCVRDLISQKIPSDWDIATSASPEEIQKLFKDSFYENDFGTVGIKTEDDSLGVVEVTTYRTEGEYENHRHPDKVSFAKNIEDDLRRRDFTINAIAINLSSIEDLPIKFIDPYGGQLDIQKKIIRTVGSPINRFSEDALRLMRAVRFSAQLNFKIEEETLKAIQENSKLLANISQERLRDELTKIIKSERPAEGITILRKTGLLTYILPEVEKGVGVSQNRHHIYTVYEHLLLSLKYCPSKKLSVRLAALLHDVAKPQTKRGNGLESTFYNHDFIGARVAHRALTRLRFSQKIIEKVSLLIENHMFYYEVETVTPASVRRLLRKVKPENIHDLIDLRVADRLGSNCPKAKPYKLRHLEYLIEKVSRDPISVKMLKINGEQLKAEAGVPPGPKMGIILNILLGEVLGDLKKNQTKYLTNKAKELNKKDLVLLKKQAKEKIEVKKIEEDRVLKKKHWVK
ncbi:MAG: CCA tRNA nucleotidyltransferase [Patescibacteria group bacterium]|nr:CCA tRNA nucleotidyltransferase [Patescibacteria group bacterium]